jgi:ABC-type glycerol-3-phosphate transport system substrate-binding protein
MNTLLAIPMTDVISVTPPRHTLSSFLPFSGFPLLPAWSARERAQPELSIRQAERRIATPLVKRLWGLAGVLLVFAGFSACSKGQKQEMSGVENITIRIASSVADPSVGEPAEFADALKMTDFYERYPSVTVDAAYFIAEYADFNQKLITMALSGSDEFDAVWISAMNVGVLANGGVLGNLDEYYAKESRFNIQDNAKWIVDAVNSFVKYNGSYYAFPWQTDCRIAFYFKPICEPLGYTRETYPKTTEEFVEFCRKVSAAGYNPWGIRNAEDWTIVYEWALMYYGDGGTFERYDESTKKWVGNLDNETGYRWIHNVRELSKTIPGDYISTMDWDVLKSTAYSGRIACHWIGPWMWTDVLERRPEEARKWETALIPAGTVKSGSSMGGWLLGTSKNTTRQKTDIFWEMIAAIASDPEAMAVGTRVAMPFMRNAYDYAEWANYDWSKEGWQHFEEQLGYAQPITTPPCEAGANIYAALWTVWQEVTMSERYSVREGTRMLNNAIQGALNDFYGY